MDAPLSFSVERVARTRVGADCKVCFQSEESE
jgi:hypothetical protein